MRRFTSWRCKHISKFNNEKIFAEILPNGRSFFPDLRVRESVFYWREDPSKIQQERKSGKIVEGGDYSCQWLHGGYQYRCDHFQVNVSKLRRPLDLEQPPDSRERTGASVRLLTCEGQIGDWELFCVILIPVAPCFSASILH